MSSRRQMQLLSCAVAVMAATTTAVHAQQQQQQQTAPTSSTATAGSGTGSSTASAALPSPSIDNTASNQQHVQDALNRCSPTVQLCYANLDDKILQTCKDPACACGIVANDIIPCIAPCSELSSLYKTLSVQYLSCANVTLPTTGVVSNAKPAGSGAGSSHGSWVSYGIASAGAVAILFL